jgi:hypothetical protein
VTCYGFYVTLTSVCVISLASLPDKPLAYCYAMTGTLSGSPPGPKSGPSTTSSF